MSDTPKLPQCGDTYTDRNDEHRTSVCTLPKDHGGFEHEERCKGGEILASWTAPVRSDDPRSGQATPWEPTESDVEAMASIASEELDDVTGAVVIAMKKAFRLGTSRGRQTAALAAEAKATPGPPKERLGFTRAQLAEISALPLSDPRVGQAIPTRKCRPDCDCLCHDTGGGVHDHTGAPCPGKFPRPTQAATERVWLIRHKSGTFMHWADTKRPEGCASDQEILSASLDVACPTKPVTPVGTYGRPDRGACPCLHTTPCDPRCTCVDLASSRGCSRCCTYGSPEQQRAAAERLVRDRTETPVVDELSVLRERMEEGRKKYPEGCTFLSLQDEVGEAAHAINKREPVDRVRDEILDAAGVAMRLYFGEVDATSTLEGLVQNGAKCRTCRKPVDHGFGMCASCADQEGP